MPCFFFHYHTVEIIFWKEIRKLLYLFEIIIIELSRFLLMIQITLRQILIPQAIVIKIIRNLQRRHNRLILLTKKLILIIIKLVFAIVKSRWRRVLIIVIIIHLLNVGLAKTMLTLIQLGLMLGALLLL